LHENMVDVGSGAGIPGIPLKILRPCWMMTLIDARAKRIRFLETAIRNLNLQQISVWHGRAEEAGHIPCFREQYDVAVARAVASMPVLCEYCLPLVRVGGIFLAMKGHPEKEKHQIAQFINWVEQSAVFTSWFYQVQIYNVPYGSSVKKEERRTTIRGGLEGRKRSRFRFRKPMKCGIIE
jgi:16S rRNA (guanine(527)-N(7))-methyltransferase RsmG